MTPLAKTLIHTVAFYDGVGKVALTKLELYKYLIVQDKYSRPAAFSDFSRALDAEWADLDRHIEHSRGYYFLKKNPHAAEYRVQRGKSAITKWRIARRMARLISLVPYVRMVAVTGSLALNSTNKQSDIDVLIAAKHGHIWTVRVLVSALMQAAAKRRYGKFIRDRICLNHYISDKEEALRPDHIFSKHISSTFIPVWKDKAYAPSFAAKTAATLKTLQNEPRFVYFLKNLFERFLSHTIAAPAESVFRNLQIRRIEGRKFIADDNALVFHHPRPANQEALYLYRENVKELGI